MPDTKVLLLACTCFAALCALTSAQGIPECPVTYKGVLLTPEQWTYGVDLDPFLDTVAAGSVLGTLETSNMTAVTPNEDVENAEYVDFVWSEQEGTIVISLSTEWNSYERNENVRDAFLLTVTVSCPEGSKVLPVNFQITFTNNHEPEFENKNNANGDGYEYLVPMPFPRGVSISAAYNPIYVFDVDILSSAVDITVALEGDVEDNFEVSINQELSNIPPGEVKKRFFVDLKAKNQLNLAAPVDLELVATDNDPDGPKSARIPIKIYVDVENSDPLPNYFDSSLYSTQITPESTVGPLTTEPGPITLLNVPEGAVVVFEILDAPGQQPVPPDMFIATSGASNSEVILSLGRLPVGEELEREAFVFELRVDVSDGAYVASTIVHVDQVSDSSVILRFDSTVYAAQLSDSAAVDDPVITTNPIKFTETPAGNVIPTLEPTSDVSLGYIDGLFRATYESGEVKIFLVRLPTEEEREEFEVVVMALKASLAESPQVSTETILQVDLPSLVDTPPSVVGSFDSALYLAYITDPEQTGELNPSETIIINDAPSGDIRTELLPAPGGAPSFVEFFQAVYVEADNSVQLSITSALSEDALKNKFLVMTLKASQDGNTEFGAETIVHVELPTEESFICTTLFPTDPPVCPTCPPCLPPTTEPPTSINLVGDPYKAAKPAGELGLLFTVVAELTEPGTPKFELVTNNENIANSVSIDPVTGDVNLSAELRPGHYEFKVTAEHSETEEKDTGNAMLDILSTATCDDERVFPYALITVNAPEATENSNLLPGDAINGDFDCIYSIYEETPFISGWFTVDVSTGALSISAAADVEDRRFPDGSQSKMMVKMQMQCEPSTPSHRLQEEMSTRQQMIVVVNLTPVNEFSPQFPQPTITVGYPVKSFARQLLPGPITTLQASDEDFGDTLTYALEFINNKFMVDAETGELYPVDGQYNYENTALVVKVMDSGGLAGQTSVQIRHITENQVAVISVPGSSTLADADRVVAELDSQLSGMWGYVKAGVIADDLSLKEVAGGGLVIVVYALEDGSAQPKPYSELKRLLADFSSSEWSVSLVQTWEDAADFPTGGGSTDDSGLTAAVITLGVLVGLLIFAIILILYFTIFRKKQKEKMLAKSGFKNRTSFSKQGSSPELGKPNGLYPDWKAADNKDDENSSQDDHDERRKSMVTFSDQPEVIPVESERL